MPIGLTVPSACPSCDAADIVRLEMTIARGTLRLCWCCRACGHDWLVTESGRRRGNPEDRRRIARGGRRADDRLTLTPELRAEAAEYAAVMGRWLNTFTAALGDEDLVGAREASKTLQEVVENLRARVFS